MEHSWNSEEFQEPSQPGQRHLGRQDPRYYEHPLYEQQQYRERYYKSPILKWKIEKFDGSEKELHAFSHM